MDDSRDDFIPLVISRNPSTTSLETWGDDISALIADVPEDFCTSARNSARDCGLLPDPAMTQGSEYEDDGTIAMILLQDIAASTPEISTQSLSDSAISTRSDASGPPRTTSMDSDTPISLADAITQTYRRSLTSLSSLSTTVRLPARLEKRKESDISTKPSSSTSSRSSALLSIPVVTSRNGASGSGGLSSTASSSAMTASHLDTRRASDAGLVKSSPPRPPSRRPATRPRNSPEPAQDRDAAFSLSSVLPAPVFGNDKIGGTGVVALSTPGRSFRPVMPSSVSGLPSSPSAKVLGKRRASDPNTIAESSRAAKFSRPILDEANVFRASEPRDSGKPVLIAYHPRLQQCFDTRELSFGVQFQIACLITNDELKHGDITMANLDKLKGTNAVAAPLTARVLLECPTNNEAAWNSNVAAFSKERAASSPWHELDREEAILRSDPYGALGFNDKYPGWYGGKIHFGGTLKFSDNDADRYKIELEPPQLGSSCRFFRRFGSRRFFRITISKRVLNTTNNGLVEYCSRPFIICGRVYRGFYAKDNHVFLVETNEIVNGGRVEAGAAPSDMHGLFSLWEFLQWHNCLEYNSRQTMAKWASRFALGLSNSVPGLQFHPSDIISINDVVSPEGSDMTDGCGLTNTAVLRRLWNHFDWPNVPTAIQCRLAGAKGLLLRHPDDLENEKEGPRAWIRPSQLKIRYSPDKAIDPALLTMDVLRASHMRSPARLSHETIINFAENGVPFHAFIKLLREALEEHVGGFIDWEGPDAMIRLWQTVARFGGIMAQRLARENAGEARARGYGEHDAADDEDDEEGDNESVLEQRSIAWWADNISGCPSTIEETVMVLLDAGFTPQTCIVLREKLHKVVENAISRRVLSFRIDIPMSCTAFVVPDPCEPGVLAPNEIQIRSPHHNLKGVDGLLTDTIVGMVLITRNPCKLPSDTQKVKAVDHPKLRRYTGVIVCSKEGSRRFADLLAGGDYDGDKGLAVWDPDLVTPFVNADLKYSEEPAKVKDSFSQENEKVSDFLERGRELSMDNQIRAAQRYLFSAIQDTSLVGKYSSYHERATYNLGYRHPESIRLAYMFCKVLDRQKTGLILLPKIEKADALAYRFSDYGLEWKETEDDHNRRSSKNLPALSRGTSLGKFVMDVLKEEAKQEGDRQRARLDAQFPRHSKLGAADPDLIAPWTSALQIADRLQNEAKTDYYHRALQKIAEHVHSVYEEHKAIVKSAVSKAGASHGTPSKRTGASFTDLPIVKRQDLLRSLSRRFASGPPASEIFMEEAQLARLRASYAYLHDSKSSHYGWSRFPFDVAMRELGLIKAGASGPSKATTEAFYTHFTMRRSSTHHS